MPIQDTLANQLHQDISQLQTDVQILKESMTTPQHQHATPLDTNPVALQQQLSKMKAEIRHLQQMKRLIPAPLFLVIVEATDGLVNCRR